MSVTIAPMTTADLDDLARLESICFSTPWTRNMLAEELDNACAAYLVAKEAESGTIVGYAGLQVAADEGYITNIAVFPACRRQGVATALLRVFLDFAQANRLSFLTLEVRAGNAAAIGLYEKYGFRQVGRRKNYYTKPKEDALLMTRAFFYDVESGAEEENV